MKNLFIVQKVGPMESIVSVREPDKTIQRQTLVIRSLDGNISDSFVSTCMGSSIVPGIQPGNIVAASLKFSTSVFNGRDYQDCICREMIIIK